MLSPPYSPYVEIRDKNVGVKIPEISASKLASICSSNLDELTDNDTEDSSGTVTPAYSLNIAGSKRTISTAFTVNELRNLENKVHVRVSTSWNSLKTDPLKYLNQERDLLSMYPLRRHLSNVSTSGSMNSDDSSLDSPSSGASSGRGRGRRPYRSSNNVNAGSRNARRVTSSSVSKSSLNSEFDDDISRESSGSQVRVHDLNISQIEDFAPSVHTLPPGKSLRAEWKGAPMDLSKDKDLHLLHPAEAHLASVLRLPCDVYLDSKRRLFAEKVHRLRQGLPFRRTDSQKACRIDVNKASRLFGAFEKIGWLEDNLFQKFI